VLTLYESAGFGTSSIHSGHGSSLKCSVGKPELQTHDVMHPPSPENRQKATSEVRACEPLCRLLSRRCFCYLDIKLGIPVLPLR
jgi:hypothetical protein